MRQDDVRRERGQFSCVLANFAGIARGPAGVDAHVAANGPAQERQRLQERPNAGLPFQIVRSCGQEHADAPHPLALLRVRREWPCDCRAPDQRDELAPSHSITPSARASSCAGTVRPSIVAVWALMISSNLVDCTTGKSAGLAPLRMRPT